jgi:mannose-6-phosphate isomerase-like protein (cupin superfamily)
MRHRRVVTGRDDYGKSVLKSDTELEPATVALIPGMEFRTVWGTDATPTLSNDGSVPTAKTVFPPPGGLRFTLITLPVDASSPSEGLDMPTALAEVEQKFPGYLGHFEPDAPGMHTTDSVDLGVVLAGEVVLELDDGVEKLLRAGDTIIQNGTRHRWHNRGPVPAVLAAVLVGVMSETSEPKDTAPPLLSGEQRSYDPNHVEHWHAAPGTRVESSAGVTSRRSSRR